MTADIAETAFYAAICGGFRFKFMPVCTIIADKSKVTHHSFLLSQIHPLLPVVAAGVDVVSYSQYIT